MGNVKNMILTISKCFYSVDGGSASSGGGCGGGCGGGGGRILLVE